MEQRYALVKQETNTVENVIVWDGESPYEVPGHVKVLLPEDSSVDIGYIYNPENNEFSVP